MCDSPNPPQTICPSVICIPPTVAKPNVATGSVKPNMAPVKSSSSHARLLAPPPRTLDRLVGLSPGACQTTDVEKLQRPPPEDDGFRVQTRRARFKKEIIGRSLADVGPKGLPVRNLKQPQVDLFIGKCAPTTEIKDIVSYLQSCGTTVLNCVPLRTPVSYTSFKVSVLPRDKAKLLDEDRWATGVIVRAFRHAKHPSRLAVGDPSLASSPLPAQRLRLVSV